MFAKVMVALLQDAPIGLKRKVHLARLHAEGMESTRWSRLGRPASMTTPWRATQIPRLHIHFEQRRKAERQPSKAASLERQYISSLLGTAHSEMKIGEPPISISQLLL